MDEVTRATVENALELSGASHFSYEERAEPIGMFSLAIACDFGGYTIAAYPSVPEPTELAVREMVHLSVIAIWKQVGMRAAVLAMAGRPADEIDKLVSTVTGDSTIGDFTHGYISVTPTEEQPEPFKLTVVRGHGASEGDVAL